jgi:L-fuculose-phosphate aldolase
MLDKKQEVIEYAKKLNTKNLSPLRSGNISIRGINEGVDGFFITPSGVKYDDITTDNIVFLELNEINNLKKISDEILNPSSEWRFHQDIYIEKRDAHAIVHAHSTHATAVSAHGKNIPAFHYMVALAGGNNIKCAEYATFGTKELSQNIIKALEERKACLMSNHGQVAFGKSLSEAFELAEEIENICHQYINTIKLGQPKILSDEEMRKILDKTKDYKKS